MTQPRRRRSGLSAGITLTSCLIGMTPVVLYTAPIDPDPTVREAQFDATAKVPLPAHVFDTGGKLDLGTSGSTTQRFSILFAPSPERPVEERAWTTGTVDDSVLDLWFRKDAAPPEIGPQMGMLGIPIEIYRSTGRVRMGSL